MLYVIPTDTAMMVHCPHHSAIPQENNQPKTSGVGTIKLHHFMHQSHHPLMPTGQVSSSQKLQNSGHVE